MSISVQHIKSTIQPDVLYTYYNDNEDEDDIDNGDENSKLHILHFADGPNQPNG